MIASQYNHNYVGRTSSWNLVFSSWTPTNEPEDFHHNMWQTFVWTYIDQFMLLKCNYCKFGQ